MKKLHKYATFSVDFIDEPVKINSLFSVGRARIFYKGLNRNRSYFDDDVAEQLASTIGGTPIVGTYDAEKGDFGGHEEHSSAYGFVPLEPHMEWVEYSGHEYLEVDVVIWDGRFEDAKEIITNNKSLSMELNFDTMRGEFVKIDGKTCYKFNFAEFLGICVLGDDVEPCFEDARFYSAYSRMLSDYATYVESIQNEVKGGNNVMENENVIVEPEVTTEETVETVEEVVEETVTEETPVEEPVAEEPVAEEAAEEEVTEESTEEEPVVEEDEPTEAETEEEVVETEETEFENKEVCPDCGENPCVCKNAKDVCAECGKNPCECECKEESKNDKDDYAALEAKYSALEAKYNEALNSLKSYTRKEKLEIISKFSTKLENEELINELTEKVDDMTTEEIKSELGSALVDQITAEENIADEAQEETNFSLNLELQDTNLGNSAWDLVKKYKNNR